MSIIPLIDLFTNIGVFYKDKTKIETKLFPNIIDAEKYMDNLLEDKINEWKDSDFNKDLKPDYHIDRFRVCKFRSEDKQKEYCEKQGLFYYYLLGKN